MQPSNPNKTNPDEFNRILAFLEMDATKIREAALMASGRMRYVQGVIGAALVDEDQDVTNSQVIASGLVRSKLDEASESFGQFSRLLEELVSQAESLPATINQNAA